MSNEWLPERSAPVGLWLRTRREGERGTNICGLRIWRDGGREWIEAATGRTTVTHHSFAAPTHWQYLGETMSKEHSGLPVHGYLPQSDAAVDLVNANKLVEERSLRVLDHLKSLPDTDQRWLAIGRTELQKAWMSINRSVFKPGRIQLPEDVAG
jgi:hypothetical protein